MRYLKSLRSKNATLTKEQQDFLKVRLLFQIYIRVAIAIAVAILTAFHTPYPGVQPNDPEQGDKTGLLIVIALLVLSCLVTLWFHLRPQSPPIRRRGDLGFSLGVRVSDFPLLGMTLDFLVLTLLVMMTGAAHSMFLPLFVIGLILSDISFLDKDRRFLMSFLFLLATAAALFLPRSESIRCWVVNAGTSPCAETTWKLTAWDEAAWVFVIFVAGGLIGSWILRAFIYGPEEEAPQGGEQHAA